MTDHRAWRLELKLAAAPTTAADRSTHHQQLARIAAELRKALGEDIVIDQDGSLLVVTAFKNVQIEQTRLALDGIVRAHGATVIVTVTHREAPGGEWAVTAGPYRAPRSRHRGRSGAVDRAQPLLSRRAKIRWLIAMLAAAAAGASYYALAPGVASFQLGFVLTLPLLITILLRIRRFLPTRVQWTLAILIAIVGPLGYLIWGGSQWWAWGQTAILPLAMLVIGRAVSRAPADVRPGPSYAGHVEGPWGPP